ncbi:hypothetical protein [Actinocorallia populi]|uniref:hypothetical protein n=1 Tax=Actinocorallia populi TaxID=2079200 RepID=UPI000D08B490|nr:hypothetical protein [Actinocorallia populi]
MEDIVDDNDLGLLSEVGEEARTYAPVLRTMAAVAAGGLLAAFLGLAGLRAVLRRRPRRGR